MTDSETPSPDAHRPTGSGPGTRGELAVPDALTSLAEGRMVVISDGEGRSDEGDVVIAAQHATADVVNFMNRAAGGWVCLALPAERCDELDLRPAGYGTSHGAPFMNPIDAKDLKSSGVSIQDQVHTIQMAIEPDRGAKDFISPGRVQPLRAEPGGVLKQAGHAEAAIDLVRLAGLLPAAVLCEIQANDGSVATGPELASFAGRHRLPVVTISDLIAYRYRVDRLVEEVVRVTLPTRYGEFQTIAYRSAPDSRIHLALVKGDVAGAEDVLVRVHTGCLAGDVFHSSLCSCGRLVEQAMEQIETEGTGVLVYIDPETRGTDAFSELLASEHSHEDRRRTESDDGLRRHGTGAQILRELRLTTIRLMTDNPKRIRGLEGFGLEVTDQVGVGDGA